jgi:hypothetical protein
MDTAASQQLPSAFRKRTVSKPNNKEKEMQASAIKSMSSYVPIIALTAAAVGWVLMFWERRKNCDLRRQLEKLEASFTSRATLE